MKSKKTILLIITFAIISLCLCACNQWTNPFNEPLYEDKFMVLADMLSGNTYLDHYGWSDWDCEITETKTSTTVTATQKSLPAYWTSEGKYISGKEIASSIDPTVLKFDKNGLDISYQKQIYIPTTNITYKNTLYRNQITRLNDFQSSFEDNMLRHELSIKALISQAYNVANEQNVEIPEGGLRGRITATFSKPISADEFRIFMERSNVLTVSNVLIKTSEDKNALILQIPNYANLSVDIVVEYLKHIDERVMQQILTSELFGIYDFNLTEFERYMLTEPDCIVGYVVKQKLPIKTNIGFNTSQSIPSIGITLRSIEFY